MMHTYYYPEDRIAVVGMGGLFPDAGNTDIFWNNILQKKVAVREVPAGRLDQKVYYRPEMFGKSNKDDKTYTKIAAIAEVENASDLCRKYRIPPAVAQHMDPNQHAAIYCVDQALQSLRSNLPKERTAVIFATGGQGKSYDNIIRRTFYPRVQARVEEYLRNCPGIVPENLDQFLKDLAGETLKGTMPISEDSAPGELQNIIAARISNIFDFWGPSFTVDAACASALAAASIGIMGLQRREFDVLITGGMEFTLDEAGLIIYSGINALSPEGSFPFDERANGFVVGLGGGVLILKRLEDALRDHDQIFALISGYGQGSDGKGKYIAAPSEEGQARVIQKACQSAGYPADTIEYIETHGTGTSVGDVAEVTALKKAFQALGITRQNYCGLGSVKSNIGHLRYASGSASLIKVSLALHEKILPPTANVQKINPKLQLDGSPFYVLTDQKPWLEDPSHPRRANISTYGFGGADYHITMEEYRPEFYRKIYGTAPVTEASQTAPTMEIPHNSGEVVFFSGSSPVELKKSYAKFAARAQEAAPAGLEYSAMVFTHNSAVTAGKKCRVAICAGSMAELSEKWTVFEQNIKKGAAQNIPQLQRKGIYYGEGKAPTPDQIALMFPGQASQYPNMLRRLRESFPAVESLHVQMDALWEAQYGYPATSLIYGTDEQALESGLKNTKNTHPAMFISNMSIYKLLTESGIQADYMIGHSLGEITALCASGMLDFKSAVRLIGARGFSFDCIPETERGIMVSVKADQAQVNELIRTAGFKVAIANINSPEQTVVGGEAAEIQQFVEFLNLKKITNVVLKTSHAFHTRLVQSAAAAFYGHISAMKFKVPKQAKVMACHLTDFYPAAGDQLSEMPEILRDQILAPVNFTDSVKKLYSFGVRIFIETGPGSVLTGLVKSILKDTDAKVITVNQKGKDALEAYQQALAELFSHGLDINIMPSNQLLKGHGWPSSAWNQVAAAGDLETPTSSRATAAAAFSIPAARESLVYSGVSLGLPGTFKKIFADDNFQLLLKGQNLIERLTDAELAQLLDQNITRLVKTEEATVFKKLTALNEVIQLAGKFGKLDMLNDYRVEEKLLEQMTFTVCAGVAAGYEALKDAGIPLVREYIKTSSGAMLPGRWALPEEMRSDTGIIYANGLFPIEMIIDEVSKHIAAKFGGKTRQDLLDFYQAVIDRVSDAQVKKLLSDWLAMHHSRLVYNGGETALYEFNHHFISLLSSQANNRLAQFIGATGPNFYISAACASTTNAVTVAEDMIRAGHARRFIVIGADSASTPEMLPWIGAGFLSIGAASDSANVFEAAVPFDKRRNGMILGSGAVGLVIEKESDVARRGMNGICRILGTHAFNAAGHQAKIDSAKFGLELDRFLTTIENEHHLRRENIAARTVYYSHETYSARQGGCSYTEKTALEKAFGGRFRDLKVINTKGMTGHPMGASIEEAVAAKILQYQQIPPIVNYQVPDPDLAGLNLSKGGAYAFDYVLRMVSGFGAQGNYQLLQKIASGDDRFPHRQVYQEWLERITACPNPVLKNNGRLLVAESAESSAAISPIPKTPVEPTSWNSTITDDILAIYAEITQYPKEMLDLSMEVEADLGIDTVKQATIFGMIAEKFHLPPSENLQLSSYPTIKHMVDLIQRKTGTSVTIQNTLPQTVSLSIPTANGEAGEVLQVISEITQYPVDMLDPAMEMEADLGIDTVKQATIFSLLGQKFGMPEERVVNVSQYRTIGSVIEFIRASAHQSRQDMVTHQAINAQPKPEQPANTPFRNNQPPAGPKLAPCPKTGNDIEARVLEVIADITKYPVEMLEKEMEMEADLGIDTVKQATIFAMLSEEFGLGENRNLNISQYRTIASVMGMIRDACAVKSENTEVEKPTALLPADSAAPTESEPDTRELCLQIPVAVQSKLESQDFDLQDKNIWVLGDLKSTVGEVRKYFQQWSSRVTSFVFTTYSTVSDLEAGAAALAKKPVDVIIDCAHIGAAVDLDHMTREETAKMLFLSGEARFIFYQKLLEHVPEPEIRIGCIVAMDGCHGYATRARESATQSTDPFFGALNGFYKALSKEWPKTRVKIIDLGATLAGSLPEKALAKVAAELQASSPHREIGYLSGKRSVLKIDNGDLADLQAVTLPDQSHFLVTGGGNGITAEIIKGLSYDQKCKITIIGRTKLPDNIAALAELDEQGLEQQKMEIHRTLQKTGRKITPIMVQTEYDKIVKAISVYHLIRQVEENGSRTLYFSCDVTDFTALQKAWTQSVAEFGPVQVLVHAAGIEKSKLLSQKTREEFAETFAVKAAGLCNLYRLADLKELKAIIGFASISGRFGNEAQTDYSSANSFISSFMAVVGQVHPEIHALSIAWSGWKDTGMAWRNEFVKTHAEELGIHLIEPGRGTAEFLRFLKHRSNACEIIVSKGLHNFINYHMLKGSPNETPLIDWVTKNGGKLVKATKVISVKRDPIIDHHRLGTTPLMPAVAFMEICAEFHSLAYGRKAQYCFRDLELTNPLKLFHEKAQEITLEVRPGVTPESFEAVFSTWLDSKHAHARGIRKRIDLNHMQVSAAPGEYLSLLELKSLENEPMEEGSTKQSIDEYHRKFGNAIQLGTIFMDTEPENNTFKRNQHGAVYSMLLPREELVNPKYALDKLLINPAFMDSIFQACGVHTVMQNDRVYLPWKVEEFGVINVPRKRCRYKAYAKAKSDRDGLKYYDVIMVNDQDEVCYYAKNVIMRMINL